MNQNDLEDKNRLAFTKNAIATVLIGLGFSSTIAAQEVTPQITVGQGVSVHSGLSADAKVYIKYSSEDENVVVYQVFEGSTRGLYSIELPDGEPVRMDNGDLEGASFTRTVMVPDDSAVLVRDYANGRYNIHKVPVGGGPSVLVTDQWVSSSYIRTSDDSDYIAYKGSDNEISVAPLSGDGPTLLVPESASRRYIIALTEDHVYYTENQSSSNWSDRLYSVPLSGGLPQLMSPPELQVDSNSFIYSKSLNTISYVAGPQTIEYANSGNALYTVSADGGAPQLLAGDLSFNTNGNYAKESPLHFFSIDGEAHRDYYIHDGKTNTITQVYTVTPIPTRNYLPTFSGDGETLAIDIDTETVILSVVNGELAVVPGKLRPTALTNDGELFYSDVSVTDESGDSTHNLYLLKPGESPRFITSRPGPYSRVELSDDQSTARISGYSSTIQPVQVVSVSGGTPVELSARPITSGYQYMFVDNVNYAIYESLDGSQLTMSILNDRDNPMIGQPEDINLLASDPSGNAVEFDLPAVSDISDPFASVSCVPEAGSVFAVGATQVDCTATDTTGNLATSSFTVDMGQPDAPVVGNVDDINVEASGPTGSAISYENPVAYDSFENTLVVGCIPASGTDFPVGSTETSCTATDAFGSVGESVFTVTVADTTIPTISVPETITVSSTQSTVAVDYEVTASDLVDGVIAVDCLPGSGSDFAVGDTIVECTATDASDNTASAAFTITVESENEPETILSVLADILALNDDSLRSSAINAATSAITRAETHLAADPAEYSAAILDYRVAMLFVARIRLDNEAMDSLLSLIGNESRRVAQESIDAAIEREGRSSRINRASREFASAERLLTRAPRTAVLRYLLAARWAESA